MPVARGDTAQRRWLNVLLLAPLAVGVGAYAWLAVAHGTPWLWNAVVHESGHYTLGGTIFFFRHHLREIPVDIVMALSLASAIATTTPESTGPRLRWPLAAAIVLLAVTFAWSVAQEGAYEAVRDVLQFRTKDDDVSYGSHWRFHFLSTIWFAAACQLLAAVTTGSTRILRVDGSARRQAMLLWGTIVVLSLVFGFTTEPFTSGRYIGHQAREIMTHGLITLPLVFAIGVRRGGVSSTTHPAGVFVTILAWLTVLMIPLFLTLAFSRTGLEETAQLSAGVSGVVAAHFFEHVLDYLLVAFLTLAMVGRKALPAS